MMNCESTLQLCRRSLTITSGMELIQFSFFRRRHGSYVLSRMQVICIACKVQRKYMNILERIHPETFSLSEYLGSVIFLSG